MAIDLVAFVAAATVAWFAVSPPFSPQTYAAASVLGAGLASLALAWCDAYRPVVLGSAAGSMRSVLMSMGLAFVVAILVYFAVPLPAGALPGMVHTAAVFFPLVLVGRIGFRAACAHWPRRILVMGTSDLAIAIARILGSSPGLGIACVGLLADDEYDGDTIGSLPIVARLSGTEKALRELDINWVVVASRTRDEQFPADLLLGAKLRGLRVDSGLAFYERLAGRIYLPNLRWSYLVFADGMREGRVAAALKRGLDLAVAVVGLAFGLPVVALAALAIALDSPGAIFFRQSRVGRGGRPFRILKLRSMRDGAESETGAVFANDEDERVTRIGRILRKTHLDELPQLWNVLLGEMSLVGPRPERPEFVETLTEHYPLFRFRALVRPGITGWAQVNYGYAGDLEASEQKLALDLFYLKNRSLMLDLAILWDTSKEVVRLRGT